jgi:hypothetical protein
MALSGNDIIIRDLIAPNLKKELENLNLDNEISWQVVNQDIQLENDTGYIISANNQVNLTLPTTAKVGNIIRILDYSAATFKITQNDNQQILFGRSETTIGQNGELISPNSYRNALHLICVSENLEFMIVSSIGNFNLK